MGFESDDASFHETHGRKYDRGNGSEALEALDAAGFDRPRITMYVLAGLPEQDPASVERSIRHVATLGARAEIAEFSPVPGSPLWDRCVDISRFPIDSEPLFQNNSAFAMRSDRFTLERMSELKSLAVKLNQETAASRSAKNDSA